MHARPGQQVPAAIRSWFCRMARDRTTSAPCAADFCFPMGALYSYQCSVTVFADDEYLGGMDRVTAALQTTWHLLRYAI